MFSRTFYELMQNSTKIELNKLFQNFEEDVCKLMLNSARLALKKTNTNFQTEAPSELTLNTTQLKLNKGCQIEV